MIAANGHLALAASVLLSTALATSQTPCQLTWQPGASTFGPGGTVRALVELPNGDLVAGGIFNVADGSVCRNVARFDGTTWLPMGDGLNSFVTDLAVMPNGDLLAAGGFSSSGTTYVGRVARWNGSAWVSIGADMPGTVTDLAVAPNGDLILAGSFTSIGTVAVGDIARWDGTTFTPMGNPNLHVIWAMDFLPNGDLVVGGDAFPSVPDVTRWNGSAWQPLAGVATNQLQGIKDIAVTASGDIAILSDNVNPVSIWNGTGLQALATPLTDEHVLATDPNGNLVVGGTGTDEVYVRINSQWQSLGDATSSSVGALLWTSTGELFAGGIAGTPITSSTAAVSRRTNAGTWQAIGVPGLASSSVNVLAKLPNGDVVAGGAFTQLLGVAANNIARFDGTAWHPMGTGTDGPVDALEVAPDGSLLIGGGFQNAGGSPASRIARWHNGNWSTIGAGLTATPRALAQTVGGAIAAVVDQPFTNTVHVFDAGAWSQLPGLIIGQIDDVVALPSSDFAMLGTFSVGQPLPVGGLRFFTTLQSVLPGSSGRMVRANARDENGELLLLSIFQSQGEVSRLVNGAVTPIATTPITYSLDAMTVLPGGDIVVGGTFESLDHIQRLHNGTWQGIDDGFALGGVQQLAASGYGDLFAAGTFLGAGAHTSLGFAHATTNCPASVTSFGAGCTGSSGPVTLSSNDLPWLGATFESQANGLPALSMAVHVIGVGAAAQPLPLGLPGCSLLVQPIELGLLFPTGGSVTAPFAIPAATSLGGVTVTTQVVGVELDPGLAITGLTSSNALQLTIGSL